MQRLSPLYLILLQEKNDKSKLKYFVLACEKLQMSLLVYYYWLINLHAKHFSLLLSFGSRQNFFFLGGGCCAQLLSHVGLFAIPWTASHQAPLSMGFSREEYWSELSFPSPGNLLDPGIKPAFCTSPALQVDSLPLYHREAQSMVTMTLNLNWKVMTIYSSNFGIKVLESLWLQTDMILALWPGSTNKN